MEYSPQELREWGKAVGKLCIHTEVLGEPLLRFWNLSQEPEIWNAAR